MCTNVQGAGPALAFFPLITEGTWQNTLYGMVIMDDGKTGTAIVHVA
jgi:hypothetical protein